MQDSHIMWTHTHKVEGGGGGGTAPCFSKGLGLIRWQAEFMELIFHGGVIHGGSGAAEQVNGCSERLARLAP